MWSIERMIVVFNDDVFGGLLRGLVYNIVTVGDKRKEAEKNR